MVNASTLFKIRPTTSLYQLRDSAVGPTEFESKCGGKVCTCLLVSCHYIDVTADMKMRMCLIGGIIILLIVIIVPAGMFNTPLGETNPLLILLTIVVATHK